MPDRITAARERARQARERLALSGFRRAATPDADEAELFDEPAPEPTRAAPTGWKKYAPAAIRGLTGLLGSEGGFLGAGIGGVGETAAQWAEKELGTRDEYSPAGIAAEAGLGAVPFSGLRKLFGGSRTAAHAIAGGALAGGGALVRQQAADGAHLPTSDDLRDAGRDAAVGAGTAGLLSSGLFRGRPNANALSKADDLTVERYAPNIPSDTPAVAGVTSSRVPYPGEMGLLRQTKPLSRARLQAQTAGAEVRDADVAARVPGFERYGANTPADASPAPRFDGPDDALSYRNEFTPWKGAKDLAATGQRAISFLRPKLRITSGQGPQTDAELNVLLREADHGKADMTHDLASASEKSSASRLHREMSILDSEYMRRLADERGSVDAEFLRDLGTHAAGAAIGGTVGAQYEEDDPMRGLIFGALAGAGAVHGVKHKEQGFHALAKLRRASMLSSPLTSARVGIGNVGSMGVEAATRGLSGDAAGAKRIMGTLFNRDAWRDAAGAAKRQFNEPVSATQSSTGHEIGSTGLLSIPERAISANDAAFKSLAERAGLSRAEGAAMTFSDEPTSKFGRAAIDLSRTPFGEFVMPFAKTGIRMAERGVTEYSPLALTTGKGRSALGALFARSLRPGSEEARTLAKVGLGTAATGVGYAADLDDPYSMALAGPMALPMMAGGLMRNDDSEETLAGKTERTMRGLARYVPGLSPLSSNPIEGYLSSFAPNAGRDVATLLDPEDRETPGVFGATVAKIPIARESLPVKGATGRRRNRRPRRGQN